jgi:hypothetical protein
LNGCAFLLPAPPTAVIPTVIGQISSISTNFPAVLKNLPAIVGEFRSTCPAVQITEILLTIPVKLTEVMPKVASIMPDISAPEIRRSWRRYREQTAKNQSP